MDSTSGEAISPVSDFSRGNIAFNKASCTIRTALSRLADSLARVDLLAAIFPQKKINFAEVLMRSCAWGRR